VIKDNFIQGVEVSVRALRLGAVNEGQFVMCVHNLVVKYLWLAWSGAGAPQEHRELLRIQHEALASLDKLTDDALGADEERVADLVAQFEWWYDDAEMTGFRVAALEGLVANEEVYYYGPDFRITEGDVDEAVREAGEMVGPEWAGLMEAEPWEDETG
jgi:hypothetical protein